VDASVLLSRLACPLIPVVVIDRLDDAVPLADALLQGGVSALEITLRTPVACEAISAMKSALPHAVIGAGTVSSGEAYETAVQSGADFIVSPGATDQLFKTAAAHTVPFLPGAVTGSEVLRAMELGYTTLKFFPAEASGGPSTLQAFSGPFPGINFMPTGGVTPHNVSTYLQLRNVCAVGGSWLTPRELLMDQQWEAVYQLAADSVTQITQMIRGEPQ
jgi:2-dehydro-3-deoxyphosphogluconate aldolase/(4S)-4-hydroxy-2-oxoglutarate aldolase